MKVKRLLVVTKRFPLFLVLDREANGWAYEVREEATSRLVCYGWTAGTKAEAVDEARAHAAKTLKI